MMQHLSRDQLRPIVYVMCALMSVYIIILLVWSGKTPIVFQPSLFKRDTVDSAKILPGTPGRYFFNRTAIKHVKISDIRQCYHISRFGLKQLFDPDSRDFLGCMQRLPHAIIIGVDGADTLSFFLKSHPSSMFAFDDELNYFDSDGRTSMNGIEWYRHKMPYTSPDQITIETSLSYFDSSTAPDGIRNNIVPRPKLVVILKDPVKRALLDFQSVVVNGSLASDNLWSSNPLLEKDKKYTFLDSKSFARDGTFSRSVIDDEGKVCAWNGIVNRGVYIINLRRWIEFFGRKQILIVDGDELERDPVPVLNDVEDFLGVPRYLDGDVVRYDKAHKMYCLNKPLHYCPMVKPQLDDGVEINPDTEATLREFYRRYDRQLYQVLNRNFSWFVDSGIFDKMPPTEGVMPVPVNVTEDDVEQPSVQLVADADENEEEDEQ